MGIFYFFDARFEREVKLLDDDERDDLLGDSSLMSRTQQTARQSRIIQDEAGSRAT